MEKKTRFRIGILSASAIVLGGGLAFGAAAHADTVTPAVPGVAVSAEVPDSPATGPDADNIQDESGADEVGGAKDGIDVEDGTPDVPTEVAEAP